MIHVSRVTRLYGDFKAVDSISFEVPDGEIVGLLGHNGAGKTTTLKMLTGFLEPTEGEIRVDGLDIVEDRLKIQQKMGYLPESSPTYPEMNVAEYLQYVARLRGIPEDRRLAAVQSAIQKTRLQEKAFSRIATLSKGLRQRVGVAQAILHRPQILILDEPTSGLDPSQILEMRSLIQELSRQATVIVSTHILQEVEAVCDRVIIILQGKIAKDAKLSELTSSKNVIVRIKQSLADLKGALSPLSFVQGIESAGIQGGGIQLYRVKIGPDANGAKDAVPAVARAISQKNWDLYGLEKEERNLETIFRDINRGNLVH